MPIPSLDDSAEPFYISLPLITLGCVLSAADGAGVEISNFSVAPQPFAPLACFKDLCKHVSRIEEKFFSLLLGRTCLL